MPNNQISHFPVMKRLEFLQDSAISSNILSSHWQQTTWMVDHYKLHVVLFCLFQEDAIFLEQGDD